MSASTGRAVRYGVSIFVVVTAMFSLHFIQLGSGRSVLAAVLAAAVLGGGAGLVGAIVGAIMDRWR